jgi:tryptophan halogenase
MPEALQPTRVLIVGGGTAGWMTAASLAHLLPASVATIELVESAAIGTVGVGEATVPHIRFFNERLGFDEADFMARTRATFKLGIEFVNWGRLGDRYIHPFGAFGDDIAGVPFHHHYTRARASGHRRSLQEYSLPIVAARNGRFAHPAEDTASPLSTFSYAYQFDAGRYAAYLRAYAESRGVRRTEGRIVGVEQDSQSGFIDSVRLDNGTTLAADLFVDCSGFRGLLIEETLRAGFDDWSHWLPCDSAFAVPCPTEGPVLPYTRATAHEAGWFWRIPLQHRIGNGHVFASEFCENDAARDALLEQLESPPADEPRLLRFRAGKRSKQWSHNVVAVGLASGFLEPLESTSIHLIQLAIGYLLELFPADRHDPMNEAEFNRIMALEYERIRDFLILHYHATERDDTDFWHYCRTMRIPDSLSYRMELFRERGLVPNYREGMFLDASWLAVYYGQNVVPASYDPLSGQLSDGELGEHLDALAREYRSAAESMPEHAGFLARLGATAGSDGPA